MSGGGGACVVIDAFPPLTYAFGKGKGAVLGGSKKIGGGGIKNRAQGIVEIEAQNIIDGVKLGWYRCYKCYKCYKRC